MQIIAKRIRIVYILDSAAIANPVKRSTCAPVPMTKYQKRISESLLDRVSNQIKDHHSVHRKTLAYNF